MGKLERLDGFMYRLVLDQGDGEDEFFIMARSSRDAKEKLMEHTSCSPAAVSSIGIVAVVVYA